MSFSRLPPLVFPVVLVTGGMLLSLLFAATPYGRQVENLTLDWRFQARSQGDPPADDRLIGVGIAEACLQKWGRWPWPREVHANLLQLLRLRPPAAVAFDLLFTEPSADPDADTQLADALVNHGGAVTGALSERLPLAAGIFDAEYAGNTKSIAVVRGDLDRLTGHDTALFPVPVIGESSYTGFVNANPGPDGIRREIPLVVRCGTRVFPSLSLQTLLRMHDLDADAVEVDLGREIRVRTNAETFRIPVDGRGHLRLNYRNPESFTFLTYSQLFDRLYLQHEGESWPEEFPPVEGQVLVIGQTAAALTDLGNTPLASHQPLMLVHLHALDNILRGDYLRAAPRWPVAVVWLGLALGLLILLREAPVWMAIAVPAGIVAAYTALAFAVFSGFSLELPLVWPVAGFALVNSASTAGRLVLESRAKARIKGMFGTYVAPTVVEQIIASGEEPKLGGSEAEITAFFSDIAGFSSFSEQLSPQQLVALMNEYLTAMTDILHEHGGTLDKFIGDAIVGMFGAPLWFAGHAHEACLAAAEMQRCQEDLRAKWERDGTWPPLVHAMRTRIGLNSGLAIIGNMGSRRRFNYTMMGDTVNLAARAESGAKSYGVLTMVTGETRALSQAVADDLRFRYLDRLIVKGRTRPVEVFELIGLETDLPSGTREAIGRYEEGIRLYLARRFPEARDTFTDSARLEPFPDENPSLVMARRCEEFLSHPPGDDWQGEHVMKTK